MIIILDIKRLFIMDWTLDKIMGRNPICFKYKTIQGELIGGLSKKFHCSNPRLITWLFFKWNDWYILPKNSLYINMLLIF